MRRKTIQKGFEFEQLFERVLRTYLDKYSWLMISDIHLRSYSRVGHSQIDFLLLTPYGYYCIETKDWDCEVTDSEGEFWHISYPETSYRVLSPIKQNLSHMHSLGKVIAPYKLRGAVVFGDDTVIQNKSDGVYNLRDFLVFLDNLKYGNPYIPFGQLREDYLNIMSAGAQCLSDEMR